VTLDEAEELRREVQEAFRRRPYPGDDAIARRRPGCAGQEAEEVWQRYHGKDWKQIVADGRQRNLRDDLGFLTFEGFVYYLPAFLELSLDAERRFDLDGTLASFLWSFPEEVASRLEPREKRVVVRVLEYLAGEFDERGYVRNDARAALEHYWAYFTDGELGH
jgi:hypothetical protein